GRGVGAVETVPRDPPLFERELDRLTVVLERDTEESDARILQPGGVSGARQPYDGEVLPEREGASVGRHARDDAARLCRRREGERRVDLAIVRVCARERPVERRTIALDLVAALGNARQRAGDVRPIA